MTGLNYALRVLKSVFSPEATQLESYLSDKNPQDSCELNYWIEQYELHKQHQTFN
jgi:hypothetical protein